MIHRIFSNNALFKEVRLRPGVNVLVATKSEGATDRDTRNGAGKSSLVEIIHFVLGGECDKRSIFRDPELAHDFFGLEFDLGADRVIARRNGAHNAHVWVKGLSNLPAWVRVDEFRFDADWIEILVEEWTAILGQRWFGLPSRAETERFSPTFRTLFPYFVRRVGGFNSPSRIFERQPLWQEQVCVTFLLGLDWSVPQAMERIRAKQRFRKQLRNALKEEAIESGGATLPTSGDLRTWLTLAENRAAVVRRSLAEFRVVDEYHQLEEEADDVTRELERLADENTHDRAALSELEEALRLEAPPDAENLEAVYKEAGIVLPSLVTERFDDVQRFHASIIKNRRGYLEAESTAAADRIRNREGQQRDLEKRQSEIWQVLQTSGALESYTALQTEFARLQAKVESLREQYEKAAAFESTGREIIIEESQLEARLVLNHREQAEQIQAAIVTFEAVSHSLYRESGRLTVHDKLQGSPISIDIPRQRSEGVHNMQVFCFDLTLVQICRERAVGPGFLVHDSHLYDPVDARQAAHGLRVAEEFSVDKDGHSTYQYLTMLNSAKLEQLEAEGILNVGKFVIPPRLSDAPDGGLFGRPFGTATPPRR